MATLPTAYASQSYGRKTLDFYAAAGEVSGGDPRARADERRLVDFDGGKHTVRLVDRHFTLEPGDQASVLRLQPGPARRSRPVAVVNHTRGEWGRTHPGASGLLSRSGVARNVNWALTMLLFALGAMVVVWPFLQAFLVEVSPSVFAAAPEFDVFALAAAATPDLAAWRFSDTAAPLSALIAQFQPSLAGQADFLVFLAVALAGGVVVYGARSWRLLWAPVYVGAIGAMALSLGGVADAAGYALSGLLVPAVLFALGGAVNRIRDAGKLERRIALLADHLLRHAPEESVSGGEAQPEPQSDAADADVVADAAPATAAAASLREPVQEPSAEISEPAVEAEPAVEDEPQADAAAAEADAAPVSEVTAETPAKDASEAEPAANDAAPEEPTAAADQAETNKAESEPDAPTSEIPAADATAEAAPTDEPDPAALDAQTAEAEPLEMGGIEPEEAERLKNDPRYAARAIVLPPPPPMPADAGADWPSDEAADAAAPDAEVDNAAATTQLAADADSADVDDADADAKPVSETRELRPSRPLPENVVPLFAAPSERAASKREPEDVAD